MGPAPALKLRLGTRGSRLALAQSGQVARALQDLHPGLQVELVPISTTGDKITDVALSRIGDRGLFVKEIEQALLDGEVDFAVHSMKDMPTVLPPALCIAAVPRRLPPFDCLITLEHDGFDSLPKGARVATGSLRRRAQLRAARPDLLCEELRGNLPTRVRKLVENRWHATVLALAGLARLGVPGLLDGEAVRWTPPADWETAREIHVVPLAESICLPAVGQGALCLETREDADAVRKLLSKLDDAPSHLAVRAERATMRALEGGCQVPIAAWARVQGEMLRMDAMLADLSGTTILRASAEGRAPDAEAVGQQVAEDLLGQGGGSILKEIRSSGH